MNSNKDKETCEEQPKKCYCARCFMPIDPDDKIDVDGQNFHKCCCMCCVCQKIPKSIKMFYGHVFCPECFNNQVKSRFRGEGPRMQSNSWWMQWAPNVAAVEAAKDSKEKDVKALEDSQPPKEPVKKCICARCLQAVDEDSKVTIGDQHFHTQCARCYCCRSVPTGNVKIYYGQLFCEECFHRYVMPRNKDNPSEFFKYCFDQWHNNSQVAENMREFMSNSNSIERPMIFVPHGCTQSFCRCGNASQDWFSKPEKAKKSNTYEEDCESILGSWDQDPCVKLAGLHSYHLTESAKLENFNVAEKIEKLTKLIHNKSSEKRPKKWKNFDQSKNECFTLEPSLYGWVDLQRPMEAINEKICPKCLWQCGPTFVSSDYLKNTVVNCVEFYTE